MPLLTRAKSTVAKALPVAVRQRRTFRKIHGRRMPIVNPQTFVDKVAWRIAYDRRPLLERTCDKLAMKEYALQTAAGLVRVPRTYWAGTDVAELAQVELPEHWVLKPNHSSQRVIIGHGVPDVADLAARTDGWVDEEYWREVGEWAYRKARPCLLVEEFIGVPGEVPSDFKVICFDGVPQVVQVHTTRFDEHRNRMYTPEWEPMPWTGGYLPGPDQPRPERLPEMLEAAALMARGYDMLRVDFYEHAGTLWFGELTPYPGAGYSKVEPQLDALMGEWWTLPPHPLNRFLNNAA